MTRTRPAVVRFLCVIGMTAAVLANLTPLAVMSGCLLIAHEVRNVCEAVAASAAPRVTPAP